MRLLSLLIAGWAAITPIAASCSGDPLPKGPETETTDSSDNGNKDNGDNESESPLKPVTTGSDTLVVWYSFTGNSKAIVDALLTHVSADYLEIKPSEEGLDYAANNYAIGSSLISAIRKNPSSASSYPSIKEVEVPFDDYKTVMIVTPLWWSQMAAPMQSFLFKFSEQIAGKTIGLIVTSSSSSISGVEQDAKRLLPEGKFASESLWIRASQVGEAKSLTASWYDKVFKSGNDQTSMKVKITAGGKTFTADIEDSQTGKAFMEKLPLTLDMSELNGNEKYCYGVSLPRNDKRYDSIVAGDLMLYSGDCIVLFYGNAGGYSYTRIGKIADTAGLSNALGKGNVTVKFEK